MKIVLWRDKIKLLRFNNIFLYSPSCCSCKTAYSEIIEENAVWEGM